MKYPDTHRFTIFDQNLAQVYISVSVADREVFEEDVNDSVLHRLGFVCTDQNGKTVSLPEQVVRNFAISLERI